MVCFDSFSRRDMIQRASTHAILRRGARGPSIREYPIVVWDFNLLFVAFRCRLLDLSFACIQVLLSDSLPIDCSLCVDSSRLAVRTKMFNVLELISRRHSSILVSIITLCVLPSVATLAKHTVSIIILIATNALNSIIFNLIFW